MSQPIPPPIPSPVPQKNRTVKVVILVLLVCLFVFVLFPIVIAAIMGVSMLSWVKQATEIHFTSYTDTFHLTILELKSDPDYFMERVRVRCERGMKASVWVADLKDAGIFETNTANGEVYYRDGQPDRIRDSMLIQADSGFSTCDILYRIQTTSTNTIWHSHMSATATNDLGHTEGGGGVDTTLPVPLKVSGVQTNWPGSYQRGSEIPLANLGDYKILLSIK
jgi:hypothetical protein